MGLGLSAAAVALTGCGGWSARDEAMLIDRLRFPADQGDGSLVALSMPEPDGVELAWWEEPVSTTIIVMVDGQ
ncbi:MAG: hypothetical protein H6811_09870 [Phycisphaeraceae bacterium]|nr:hypothetical protein [Phycisphaeraceae bacterium]